MNLNNSRPAKRVRRQRQRRQRIDRLYEHLADVVTLVPDADLQDDVMDWLDEAGEAPSASLADHIQQTLVEFETRFAMYRTGSGGDEDFPDECAGCEHHPDACPIFTKRTWETELERLEEELVGAGESEVKQRYRRFAGRVGCHVIPERIDEWETNHRDVLEEGRDLRRETIHLIRPKDESERAADAAAEELDAAADGGGRR